MKQKTVVNYLAKVARWVREDGGYREKKEFLSAYKNGLSWFENMSGGPKFMEEVRMLAQDFEGGARAGSVDDGSLTDGLL